MPSACAQPRVRPRAGRVGRSGGGGRSRGGGAHSLPAPSLRSPLRRARTRSCRPPAQARHRAPCTPSSSAESRGGGLEVPGCQRPWIPEGGRSTPRELQDDEMGSPKGAIIGVQSPTSLLVLLWHPYCSSSFALATWLRATGSVHASPRCNFIPYICLPGAPAQPTAQQWRSSAGVQK